MEESKKYTFEKLTPVDNCDISVYESAIDFAFEEKDIRNIAISGAYGAGKRGQSQILCNRQKRCK